MDIVAIHEFLMYRAEITPDPRIPTYVYSGGDRVTSVSRYIMKHIDLELAKQYA
jgi:methylaspartate ammonia-lyase